MARLETREVWIAEDGREFDTRAAAENYERVIIFARELGSGTTISARECEEVADFVLKNYEIRRFGRSAA